MMNTLKHLAWAINHNISIKRGLKGARKEAVVAMKKYCNDEHYSKLDQRKFEQFLRETDENAKKGEIFFSKMDYLLLVNYLEEGDVF